MPVVIVETWSGKSEEQKAKLIKGITKAFEEIGVTADQVHVIIHDVPKANWACRAYKHPNCHLRISSFSFLLCALQVLYRSFID